MTILIEEIENDVESIPSKFELLNEYFFEIKILESLRPENKITFSI